MKSEDPDLVGVVENGSKVRVVSIKDRKEAFTANMEGAGAGDAVAVRLLRDPYGYYVAVQGTNDPEVQSVQPNLLTNIGLRALPVNGKVFCFKPDGTRVWEDDVKNEMLVLESSSSRRATRSCPPPCAAWASPVSSTPSPGPATSGPGACSSRATWHSASTKPRTSTR
jgi:hypothetical protein